jgi:hypothetical protein
MAAAHVETPGLEQKPTARDRVVDACRHAAHISHEARLIKSVAEDAIEDGVHAVKRAITSVRHRVEELGDLKDGALRRVKRQPLQAMAAAFGIGLAAGVAVGWIACRPRTT